MIYEDLRERIGVRADFRGRRVTPLAFRRKGRVHRLRQVAARWEERQGGRRLLYFSCLDDAGDLYQLHFDAVEVSWHLDAVQVAADPVPFGRARPADPRRSPSPGRPVPAERGRPGAP
jgi:hypothetical protein